MAFKADRSPIYKPSVLIMCDELKPGICKNLIIKLDEVFKN